MLAIEKQMAGVEINADGFGIEIAHQVHDSGGVDSHEGRTGMRVIANFHAIAAHELRPGFELAGISSASSSNLRRDC